MSQAPTTGPGGGAAVQWRLDDRGALVTGASAGLGARFARVPHQAGAHVVVTVRRANLLDQLARECGERIEVMPGDITDASHRQALAGRLAAHGRLDVLVNKAGICDDGPIEQQSVEELRRVIELNLISQQVIAHRVTSSGMPVGRLDQCRRARRRREMQRRRDERPDGP